MTEAKKKASPGVKRIWLVRHGQTLWTEQKRFCGHSDIPLSTTGRKEARWVAAQLQTKPLVAIYSSDLLRTRETAEIIRKKFVGGIHTVNNADAVERVLPEVVTSRELREINFGQWEGLTYEEIVKASPGHLDFFSRPADVAPPAGETLAKAVERALSTLLTIAEMPHRGDIVAVSHGGILAGILCSLLGMPLNNQWQLHINTGALSAVDVSFDVSGTVFTSLVLFNKTRGRA